MTKTSSSAPAAHTDSGGDVRDPHPNGGASAAHDHMTGSLPEPDPPRAHLVMRPQYKVLGLSVVFFIGVCVADALLDSLAFHNRPFLDSLIRDVPTQTAYYRLIMTIFFLVFGFIVSRTFARLRAAEEARERLILDLTAAKEALEYQASHDELCGVWNRSAIMEKLGSELARAEREGARVGVIMADIDHFKHINDEHGHLVGDAALQGVARRLTRSVRPYDAVGRYGGEEFLIITPGMGSETVEQIAERLRLAFDMNPVETADLAFPITVSFGAATAEPDGSRPADEMVKRADDALYRAKRLGRNRVELG